MLLVWILAVAALLVALGIAWLLRNELAVNRDANDYATGGVSFDREQLGA